MTGRAGDVCPCVERDGDSCESVCTGVAVASATLARVDGPATGDSLSCVTGNFVGLPLRAAWKAAVATAEDRLVGELLVLSLAGDKLSTRRFLVGVSGKGARSSVRFLEGVDVILVCGLRVDFIGDLK